MNRFFILGAVALLGILLSVGVVIVQQNIRLRASLAEAAKTVRLQEEARKLADSVLTDQEQKENEIASSRKQLEQQLEEAACIPGPAYVDYLLQLLGDDAEARCSKAATDAAR